MVRDHAPTAGPGFALELSELLARVEKTDADDQKWLFHDVRQLLLPARNPKNALFIIRFNALLYADGYESAALALVERVLPGWGATAGYPARLGQHGGQPWGDVWAARDDESYPWAPRQMRPTPFHSNAETPALAVLAALLKALQAQPDRHDARDGASPPNPEASND